MLSWAVEGMNYSYLLYNLLATASLTNRASPSITNIDFTEEEIKLGY